MPGARDVVVRCSAGAHRVRLKGGAGLWASARCPRCRTTVDPTRLRRLAAAVVRLRRPAAPDLLARATWSATWVWMLGILAAAALLWLASDRWWPATVLLFGPRWVLVAPLALLLPAVLAFDRALLPLLVVGALVGAGPLLGFRTGWRAWLPGPGTDGPVVRVATFNARSGSGVLRGPGALAATWQVDVAAFQECAGGFADLLRILDEGWSASRRASLCLVTRYPILEVREMDRSAFEFAGGSGLVVTWTLDVEGTPVHVTNLHLETPRAGFELIRSGRLTEGIRRTRRVSTLREAELRRAATWVSLLPTPRIVVGDFNTPPESRSYREAFGAWRNAFSQAGLGLGGTRLNGWIRARIDHVLVDGRWTVLEARVGEDVGSDHLPVLTTLRLRPAPP